MKRGLAHRRRRWTCITSDTVIFVNSSSGFSTGRACGFRGGANIDACRGGHGEVGVRKVGNGDNWEVPLEGWYNPADKGEGEETETVDGRRAIRASPKTRRGQRCTSAELSHCHNNTAHLLNWRLMPRQNTSDLLWQAETVKHEYVRFRRV